MVTRASYIRYSRETQLQLAKSPVLFLLCKRATDLCALPLLTLRVRHTWDHESPSRRSANTRSASTWARGLPNFLPLARALRSPNSCSIGLDCCPETSVCAGEPHDFVCHRIKLLAGHIRQGNRLRARPGAVPPKKLPSRRFIFGSFSVHYKMSKFCRLLALLLTLVLSLQSVAGTISGQIQTATGGPVANAALTFNLSQGAVLAKSASSPSAL